VLHDGREGSPTAGSLMEVFMGPDSHLLTVIPPGVTNGMKGMSQPFAIVANCATHTHAPGRTTRADPFGDAVPYEWVVRNH
jgi:dTDP-4-dehydrorhamnose 3,5-epimerase